MNPGAALELRDIHLPAEPGWWPPAPGWWLLALLLVALSIVIWRRAQPVLQRRRRRRRLLRGFDQMLRGHDIERQPAPLVAAMSELLRVAVRDCVPAALPLQGEAWLAFLDGDDAARPFTRGAGRVLLDGPYRRDLPTEQAQALIPLVRRRLASLAGDADV